MRQDITRIRHEEDLHKYEGVCLAGVPYEYCSPDGVRNALIDTRGQCVTSVIRRCTVHQIAVCAYHFKRTREQLSRADYVRRLVLPELCVVATHPITAVRDPGLRVEMSLVG